MVLFFMAWTRFTYICTCYLYSWKCSISVGCWKSQSYYFLYIFQRYDKNYLALSQHLQQTVHISMKYDLSFHLCRHFQCTLSMYSIKYFQFYKNIRVYFKVFFRSIIHNCASTSHTMHSIAIYIVFGFLKPLTICFFHLSVFSLKQQYVKRCIDICSTIINTNWSLWTT